MQVLCSSKNCQKVRKDGGELDAGGSNKYSESDKTKRKDEGYVTVIEDTAEAFAWKFTVASIP